MQVLYAYVDGCDLDGVETELVARFDSFVGARRWTAGTVSVVNQRGEDAALDGDDLPGWDLGLNLTLEAADADCRADIEALVALLGQLHVETGRDFVVGLADPDTGVGEDIWWVSSPSPDAVELLRALFGDA